MDIDHWPYCEIVQFAKDAASDRNWLLSANIKLAKAEADAMRILENMTIEFEIVCDQFQKVASRSKAYRDAKELLK